MVKVVLKEGVNWVGAVDWNIRDFHGYIHKQRQHLQCISD